MENQKKYKNILTKITNLHIKRHIITTTNFTTVQDDNAQDQTFPELF